MSNISTTNKPTDWLFDLIDCSNTLQAECWNDKQSKAAKHVLTMRFDAEHQVIKMTWQGCDGWWHFSNQQLRFLEDGVTARAMGSEEGIGPLVEHRFLFMNQDLSESIKYKIRDAKTSALLGKITKPAAPFVYRLEDSSGHRHLVRYLRNPGDGNHQRTFIDSASLEDDNGLRRLLQMTRDRAAQDGGEGYYDTEMIWMQKGRQLGSVDGPAIPPMPSQTAQAEAVMTMESALGICTVADFDALYQEVLDHCNLAHSEAAAANDMLQQMKKTRAAVVELEKVEKGAADAAFDHLVPVIRERMRETFKFQIK